MSIIKEFKEKNKDHEKEQLLNIKNIKLMTGSNTFRYSSLFNFKITNDIVNLKKNIYEHNAQIQFIKNDNIILASYSNLNIEILRTSNGRIKIIKYFEECIPNNMTFGLESLNKIVSIKLIQKLAEYFCIGTGTYKFDAGYDNLPENLLQQLIKEIEITNSK
jgi:hypothetical protein